MHTKKNPRLETDVRRVHPCHLRGRFHRFIHLWAHRRHVHGHLRRDVYVNAHLDPSAPSLLFVLLLKPQAHSLINLSAVRERICRRRHALGHRRPDDRLARAADGLWRRAPRSVHRIPDREGRPDAVLLDHSALHGRAIRRVRVPRNAR